MKNVIVATPAYDWRVDVRYVDALMQAMVLCAREDVALLPLYAPGDARIDRARNFLFSLAMVRGDVSDLLFIDSDTLFAPASILRLLKHDVEVVGGVVPKKDGGGTACFKPLRGAVANADGLLEVEAVGAGLLRIRASAMKRLWRASREYRDGEARGREVFAGGVHRGELESEDIAMCRKWRLLGGHVYVDTAVSCAHVGAAVYTLSRGEEKK